MPATWPIRLSSLLPWLFGLTVGAVWWGLWVVIHETRRCRRWRALLRASSVSEKGSRTADRWPDRILYVLTQLGHWGIERGIRPSAQYKADLVSAGIRHPDAVVRLVGVKLGAALLALGLMGLGWSVMVRDTPWPLFILGLSATVLFGWHVPDLWLAHKLRTRQARLAHSVPDLLDLLIVCIRAGLSLGSALERTGKELSEAHPELSEELRLLAFELRSSRSRSQALRDLALRTRVEALRNLASVLIQTERFGVSLIRSLRLHAEALRRHHELAAEELAGALPVKLLFPLIFFIFPSLFVVLLGPALIRGMDSLGSFFGP